MAQRVKCNLLSASCFHLFYFKLVFSKSGSIVATFLRFFIGFANFDSPHNLGPFARAHWVGLFYNLGKNHLVKTVVSLSFSVLYEQPLCQACLFLPTTDNKENIEKYLAKCWVNECRRLVALDKIKHRSVKRKNDSYCNEFLNQYKH